MVLGMELGELIRGFERNESVREKIIASVNNEQTITEILEAVMQKQEICETVMDNYQRDVIDRYNLIQGLPPTTDISSSALPENVSWLGLNLQGIKISSVEVEHAESGASKIRAVKNMVKRGITELSDKGGTSMTGKCYSIRGVNTRTTVYSTHGVDTDENIWRYILNLKTVGRIKRTFQPTDPIEWIHGLDMRIYIPLFDGYYMHYPKDHEGVRLIFSNTMMLSVDMSKLPEYINLLEYAKFYQHDEYMREKIREHKHADCAENPYYCEKKYIVPFKAIINRRVRKELASGGMILIHKRFALTTVVAQELLDDEQKKAYLSVLNTLISVMRSFQNFRYEVSVTEREMSYKMGDDILAFKRLQCFNTYFMSIFTFNLQGRELELATNSAMMYMLEPLYAAKYVRSAMQLIQTFLCSDNDDGFAIDYEQIDYKTPHPDLKIRGVKKVSERPWTLAEEHFEENLSEVISRLSYYDKSLYQPVIDYILYARSIPDTNLPSRIFAITTNISSYVGFYTIDGLSAHFIKMDKLPRTAEPDSLIMDMFESETMDVLNAFPYTKYTIYDAVQDAVKDTSSSMEFKDAIIMKKFITKISDGKFIQKQISMNATTKKKNIAIMRISDMALSDDITEKTVVSAGFRVVKGAGDKFRTVVPRPMTVHLAERIVGRPFNLYQNDPNKSSDTLNATYAQGSVATAPHNAASKSIFSSADDSIIVCDMDGESFDMTQAFMKRYQNLGYIKGIQTMTKLLDSGDRRVGTANVFELAKAILWEREFPSGENLPETLEQASKDFTYLRMDTPTGPVEICYPGNESGAIDTTFRNNVTFKTVKEWIEPRLMRYIKEKYSDIDVRDMTSANFGDDLCSQVRFGVQVDARRDMCKDITRKIIELFHDGPAKWGLKTHASKGDLGWGRSEFIKIRSQRGKVMPNYILDPYTSEKAPTVNYSVQLK